MIGRDRWRVVAADVRTCRLRAGSGVTGQLGTHCLLVRQSSAVPRTLARAPEHRLHLLVLYTLHRCACTCHHLLPLRNAPQTYNFFTGVESVESLRFKTCELVSQNVMVMIISVLHLRYPVGCEGEGLKISKIYRIAVANQYKKRNNK